MLNALLFLSLLTPADSLPRRDSILLHELVVVSASRTAERFMRSPVSIDVLDSRSIRLSAQPSYYDAIENLKGVQLLTPSLGFKVYNTRGFANPTNVRFVQLVDGRDNQAPHIGAPIAAALAPSDLDIQRVELIPGTASALYGMNALNGLSISQKMGVNHVATLGTLPQVFSETSLRYAARLGTSWAYKINLTYQHGYDWIATDATDLAPNLNASLGLSGLNNPAADPVNSYGNETANRRTLSLGGRNYVVARTGYYEQQVTDYRLRNLTGSVALHYRPTRTTELAYVYQGSSLDNVYQRTNRFRLAGYRLDQHSLTYTAPSVQLRVYHTRENTGQSYNIRSMAENIDRSFKSDNQWFADFSQQFRASVAAGTSVSDALQAARTRADAGRPLPGTEAFEATRTRLADINNWDVGAALRVRAWLCQIEPTQRLWAGFRQRTHIDLLAGFDYRTYVLYPDGNYFINPVEPDQNLTYTKVGGFVQASRPFFGDRLKLTGSVRVDKNSYFAARLNPRVAVVYSPTEAHNLRASFQNGYRFPSLFEAFSNVNSGGVRRVGGIPLLAGDLFERSYFRTSIDVFQAAINADVNTNRLTMQQAIEKNKGLLRPNTYTYLKPEAVNTLEVGYKGLLANQRLFVDADIYYSVYRNFMAQVEANVPKLSTSGNVPDSIPYALADRTRQDRYRLWTNSRTVVRNYGASLGLRYAPGPTWVITTNATYARLDRTDSGDGLDNG
jgi:outer membrane receptor protein involved in Fe transport